MFIAGVVVSSLTLHRGNLGSIPGFGIQAVQIHALNGGLHLLQ